MGYASQSHHMMFFWIPKPVDARSYFFVKLPANPFPEHNRNGVADLSQGFAP